MRHHYLVAYDICDPVRLRRVHRTVRDFGDPMQLSVFACELSALDRTVLETRLLDIIDATVDQVMFVRLGPVHRADEGPPGCHVLGRAVAATVERSIVT